ncbi:MAG: hypothetical protein AABX33_05115 [Nanoarchaeota archaeon]
MEKNYDKYTVVGLLAGTVLLIFYFTVASLLGGVSFAVDNFVKLWYWMIPLIVGFGIQMAMFFYIKGEMHRKASAEAAASAGISATSMVACCAHHVADIAPFLGISALGLFLTKYQSTFLLMGIFSNVLGIAYMASLMYAGVQKQKIKLVFYSLLAVSVISLSSSYYFTLKSQNVEPTRNAFQTLISNENNVEFQVTPVSPSEFQIVISTHSVDLDFDLTQISTLNDGLGNIYKPLKWEGSEPGGHHRSGILKFPEINSITKSIKLEIRDSTKREFKWNLD